MEKNHLNEEKLLEAIESLRSEIDRLKDTDAQASQRLNGLLEDLEHKLEHPDDEAHHHTLLENLRQSIEHFEVEHPNATGIVNHIMTMLSNLGI